MSSNCCGSDQGCCAKSKQPEKESKEGKMCYVCDDKFSVSALSKLVKDPTHMCGNCGRVTNDGSKLCNPQELNYL